MNSEILIGKQLNGHPTSSVYNIVEAFLREWALPRNSNVTDVEHTCLTAGLA